MLEPGQAHIVHFEVGKSQCSVEFVKNHGVRESRVFAVCNYWDRGWSFEQEILSFFLGSGLQFSQVSCAAVPSGLQCWKWLLWTTRLVTHFSVGMCIFFWLQVPQNRNWFHLEIITIQKLRCAQILKQFRGWWRSVLPLSVFLSLSFHQFQKFFLDNVLEGRLEQTGTGTSGC